MKYFWDAPGSKIGLKADIERHCKKEQELLNKIDSLREEAAISSDRVTALAVLRDYYSFLDKLRQSKAEVVAKLGRKV